PVRRVLALSRSVSSASTADSAPLSSLANRFDWALSFGKYDGQRTYNGVAIVAREPIEDVSRSMNDGVEDDHSRLISGRVFGTRFLCTYFPNGGAVDSDKYVYKRAWMERLRTYLDTHHSPDEDLILTGDFNVAPFADDIERSDEYEGSVLANDEIRGKLEHIRAFGLKDAFRPFHPSGQVYTWWDYRGMGFERNNGMRIDHFYVTASVAKRVIGAAVDRDERHGKGASDHAPVLLEVDRDSSNAAG
ncbi:MAG: exodeoxyribonuclease III, partial [Myxococcota bacterium]